MGSTSTTAIIEAPEERIEEALKQDGSPNEAGKLHKELREKHFGSSGKGTEQAPKQDGSLDEAGKPHKELAEKKFLSPGKGTEQVELPQNKKSEAAITNGTNERPVSIRRNQVKAATGSHHVGVSGCNNRVQGTGCDIEDNEVIESTDSQFVGVFNCGNDSKIEDNKVIDSKDSRVQGTGCDIEDNKDNEVIDSKDNRVQGTGCDIEDNEVDSKDSQFVGVFNCGNDSKKPN